MGGGDHGKEAGGTVDGAAGAVGEVDFRGVQAAGCCKQNMGVRKGADVGRAVDGTARQAGEGDIGEFRPQFVANTLWAHATMPWKS